MAVRLDKLQAIKNGNISSVKVGEDTPNGRHVILGSQVAGNRELFVASTPTAVTTDEILLVAEPELNYEAGKGILDFTNKAGKAARAYHYTVGDIVTITNDQINGTSVIDQFLIPANGSNQLVPSATVGSTRFSAKVIWKGNLYGVPATKYRVVKA